MVEPGGATTSDDHTAYDDDGLRLRQVTDIATNHREIRLACRKRIGRFKRRTAVDDLQPHRRVRRNEPARNGRHCLGGFAVDRAHRHAQRCRTRIIPIGKQACAGRESDNAEQQEKAKPQRQFRRNHARHSPTANCRCRRPIATRAPDQNPIPLICRRRWLRSGPFEGFSQCSRMPPTWLGGYSLNVKETQSTRTEPVHAAPAPSVCRCVGCAAVDGDGGLGCSGGGW